MTVHTMGDLQLTPVKAKALSVTHRSGCTGSSHQQGFHTKSVQSNYKDTLQPHPSHRKS
jgi:hypothetical protein